MFFRKKKVVAMWFPFIDNPAEFLPYIIMIILPPKNHLKLKQPHSLFVKASLSLPSSNSQLATMEIDCACVCVHVCVLQMRW